MDGLVIDGLCQHGAALLQSTLIDPLSRGTGDHGPAGFEAVSIPVKCGLSQLDLSTWVAAAWVGQVVPVPAGAGAQHAVALRLLLSGNVDIILGHLSRVSRHHSTLQALWGVLYLVLTLIGHWLVLLIRRCVQIGASGGLGLVGLRRGVAAGLHGRQARRLAPGAVAVTACHGRVCCDRVL